MVKNPLSLPALDALLGLDVNTPHVLLNFAGGGSIKLTSSEPIISLLGSIFQWSSRGLSRENVIRVLHPSLIDFLTDDSRCYELAYQVDCTVQNKILLSRCIALMHKHLHRDICQTNNPLTTNSSLHGQLEKWIPEELQYACQFWVAHLKEIPRRDRDSSMVAGIVKNFLFQHVLHWIEVLILVGAQNDIVHMIQAVIEWYEVCRFLIFFNLYIQ